MHILRNIVISALLLINASCFGQQGISVIYVKDNLASVDKFTEEGENVTDEELLTIKNTTNEYQLIHYDNVSLFEPTDPNKPDIVLEIADTHMTIDLYEYRNGKVQKDFKTKKMIAQQSMFWKLFLIEDTLPSCDWTILDSTRVVGDYQCRLARGIHPIYTREIYVWFTDEIPVQDGPDIYWGLPGLILEINHGATHLKAKRVTYFTEPIEFGVPDKGVATNIEGMQRQAPNPGQSLRRK